MTLISNNRTYAKVEVWKWSVANTWINNLSKSIDQLIHQKKKYTEDLVFKEQPFKQMKSYKL